MIHHLINEKDAKRRCSYCHEKLDTSKWASEFETDHHYKTIACKCGKKNVIKMDFHGSGHDRWSGLEKRAKKHAKN